MEPKQIILPTTGRMVHFYLGDATIEGFSNFGGPCSAQVAYVHGERSVNLSVADHRGQQHHVESVRLLQPGETPPTSGWYAEWMPFQKGQAGKTDELTPRVDKLEERMNTYDDARAASTRLSE